MTNKKKKQKYQNHKNSINADSIEKVFHTIFYKFLCWYSMVDGITSNKELNNKFYSGFSSSLLSTFKSNKYVNVDTIEEVDARYCNSHETFTFHVNNTIVLDMLRHIRNAIAHDNIKYDSLTKMFYIEDCNAQKKCTAKGCLKKSSLRSLMDLCISTKCGK